jgi:peptidoglycan/LPS O-acetylase OafA/YrhL
LRGWAALSVLLYHAYWELLGAKFPELRHGALALLCNGPLAVSIFFILSGDALLTPFLARHDFNVLRTTAFRRYTRLTVPILMAALLTYLVMKLGWLANTEAAHIMGSEHWLGTFAQFTPSFPNMLRFGLYGVYFETNDPRNYNPFLWTMSIEMLGSLLMFVFGMQVERLRRPALVALVIAVFLYAFKSYQGLFFLGAFFAIRRQQGGLQAQLVGGSVWAARLLSFALLGFAFWSCARSSDLGNESLWLNALRAAAVVTAVHLNPDLVRLMQTRLSLFMGRMSFPLYLVHFAILITLTSHLVVAVQARGGVTVASGMLIFAATVVASMAAAWVFANLEERALRGVNRQLDKLRLPAPARTVP